MSIAQSMFKMIRWTIHLSRDALCLPSLPFGITEQCRGYQDADGNTLCLNRKVILVKPYWYWHWFCLLTHIRTCTI